MPRLTGMNMPAQPGGLSRRERIGLLIHRQLDRRLSRFGVWVMRRTRGSLADRFRVHALVLSTVGRKTGRPRDVVLQYFPDGDSFVVVATNDGGASDPAWYLNLMASGRGQVEVKGRRTAVAPVRLEREEASAWWQRILELSPEYERYARAADRAFPVVRLVPTA
jgi:deazaflavin-dependent oxidoreductase (nitroreductase family)